MCSAASLALTQWILVAVFALVVQPTVSAVVAQYPLGSKPQPAPPPRRGESLQYRVRREAGFPAATPFFGRTMGFLFPGAEELLAQAGVEFWERIRLSTACCSTFSGTVEGKGQEEIAPTQWVEGRVGSTRRKPDISLSTCCCF